MVALVTGTIAWPGAEMVSDVTYIGLSSLTSNSRVDGLDGLTLSSSASRFSRACFSLLRSIS